MSNDRQNLKLREIKASFMQFQWLKCTQFS